MGFQNQLVRRLPVWVRTAPLDATFCVLGIPGAALAVAGVVQSQSLDQFLPGWGRLLWSICLFSGCVLWLAGLTSIKENNGHMTVTRMPILIFGLYLTSLAALVYGVALILIAGWSGVLAAWPVLVFAGGTWLRRLDLVSRFREEGDH